MMATAGRLVRAVYCIHLLFTLSGCGSSGAKVLHLQLRSWTGPPPRIGLRVVSKLSDDDDENRARSAHWTEACYGSLGRYSYIIDRSSPVQVVLEVIKEGDRRVVQRRVTSAERGVVSFEPMVGTDIKKLCPDAAKEGLNAYAAEVIALSTGAQPQPLYVQAPPRVAPPPVAAQPIEAPPPMPEHGFDAAGGKRQLQAADAYLAAGDIPHAVEHYLSAYEKLPLPLLLVKIGKCYRQLGRRADAVKYFEQYVAIEPNGPESKDVREWMRTLRR